MRKGGSSRRVRDVEVKEVEAVRWRCRDCGRTMREYPCGVGRASQTERVRVLVAIGWSLGPSLRAVVWWMAATVGVRLGVTTAWRDVRAVAEAMRRRRPARVRVLGVDGTGVRWGGQTRGMVVAVDLGTGRPVALAAVDERSPEAVRARRPAGPEKEESRLYVYIGARERLPGVPAGPPSGGPAGVGGPA